MTFFLNVRAMIRCVRKTITAMYCPARSRPKNRVTTHRDPPPHAGSQNNLSRESDTSSPIDGIIEINCFRLSRLRLWIGHRPWAHGRL